MTRSAPTKASGVSSSTTWSRPLKTRFEPGAALGCEEAEPSGRKIAFLQQLHHDPAHRSRGADHYNRLKHGHISK